MKRGCLVVAVWPLVLVCFPCPARAQSAPAQSPEAQAGAQVTGSATKNSSTGKTNGAGEITDEHTQTATGAPAPLPTTAPAPPPPGPVGRPRIGLALGGGGALAMSEIGVLQWFDEHHIPVDVLAGTSMGCMVGALYSTGKSTDQLKNVMNDAVFNSVFRFSESYRDRSFRRREDTRDLPNGFQVGLKHGVNLRNAVLTDQGLNDFLDRQFFRYDDRTDFNTLPIPLRCIATDLTDARVVTFARGSLPDAVRASVSLPAVYPPFRLNGHALVDGGVLDNLPTRTVHDMQADVVLAVSLPLSPLGQGDLGSILGILQRSFSVAIEGAERDDRKLANVVIMPDLTGFTQTDYLRTPDLAARGYQAAEARKSALLAYRISDADWQTYLAGRASRLRGRAATILRIRVAGPGPSVTRAIQRRFQVLVDQPVDFAKIEELMGEVRSDGRYVADYTVGYEPTDENRPVILVTVSDRQNGPPFLDIGGNIEAQAGGITQATLQGRFVYQDLGGYGSELRGNLALGYVTELGGEYDYQFLPTGHHGGFFLAPQANFERHPYNIFQSQHRLAERELQTAGGALDLGWSDSRNQELRFGYQLANIRWTENVGSDGAPNIFGTLARSRIHYTFDNRDRALVPQFGIRFTTDLAYLHKTIDSRDAPQLSTQVSYAHAVRNNSFILSAEGGTMFNRQVAQPFRFTLGGPARLSAAAIDEFRGTDYFLLEPAYLRRVAHLPAPLGQNIYLGLAYEAGQIRAPDQRTITRQDIYFGVVAETPLGLVTFSPAFGDGGYRKFNFTLGRLF